ncbi:MAG: hypothetical protein M1838_006159 [Thelocarpon superellum]|nr:MAG: hypothetical protein M1838_006159 [Thelocarpon superellum]
MWMEHDKAWQQHETHLTDGPARYPVKKSRYWLDFQDHGSRKPLKIGMDKTDCKTYRGFREDRTPAGGVENPPATAIDSSFQGHSFGDTVVLDEPPPIAMTMIGWAHELASSVVDTDAKSVPAISQIPDAAGVLGVAAAFVSILFIIFDFTHGDPVGGAWGIAGLAAAVLPAFFGGGAFLIATEVPILKLFVILSSVISPLGNLPTLHNTREIVQSAMFGDAILSGNENVAEESTGSQAIRTASSLYGPGTIARSLKWGNFQAVTFLLDQNDGHSMKIPEIAAAFQITKPAIASGSSEATATIHCEPECTRWGC